MEFTSKKSELKVTLGGVTYDIRTPTLRENTSLNAELSKTQGGVDVFEIYYTFFEKLGLPKDAVLDNLDAEGFHELIKFILSPKKTLKEIESL